MARKGQAAMEFLMTYGWAILAAVIAIGVLAYFGVFSPGRYASSICTINAPFGTTQEFAIKTADVSFVLRNGGGETADIKSIAISGCGTKTYSPVLALADGTSELITVTCSPALTSKSKFKGAITITYQTGERLLDLTATGDIGGTVA